MSVPARLRAVGALCAGLVITTTVVFRLQAQAPPSPTTEFKLGTGFVLGKVVDATTGEPIAGAIVEIQYAGPVSNAYTTPVTPFVGVPPAVPRRVITDSQGHFFFRQLAGGRYQTVVNAPGYMFGGYLQLKPGGTLHYLDLDDGAARADVVIKLWKYGAISGTVLDERGEPAVGAVVRVITRAMIGGIPRFTGSYRATTDDRGFYRVGGLTPDTYVVGMLTVGSTLPVETADSYAGSMRAADGSALEILTGLSSSGSSPPMSGGVQLGSLLLDPDLGKTGFTISPPDANGKVHAYATTFYPNAPTSTQASPVTVHAGEERTGVDLTLKLMPMARVAGTVVVRAGPASNIAVRLVPQSAIEFSSETLSEIATTATDGSGTFTLLGVPPGDYLLKVLKPSLTAAAAARLAFTAGAPAPLLPPASPEASDPTLWAAIPVHVADADVTGLSVVLKNGLRVRGRVQFEGKKDKPLPADLSRIVFTLSPVGSRPAVPFPPGRVRPEGDVTTQEYPPGRYFVTAAMAGWTLSRVMHGALNVADAPLEIEDKDIDDLVVVFTDQAATIGGHVTDGTGAADTSAEVMIFPADSETWRQTAFSPRRYRLLVTTKAGDYEFVNMPSGDYFVVAVKNDITDNWQDPKFLERLVGLASRTTLKDGDKIQLALKTVTVRR
jgi:hypothetical protein